MSSKISHINTRPEKFVNCIFLAFSEICCSLKDKTFECHIPPDFGSKFTIVSLLCLTMVLCTM